jgi:hypothetical protein
LLLGSARVNNEQLPKKVGLQRHRAIVCGIPTRSLRHHFCVLNGTKV